MRLFIPSEACKTSNINLICVAAVNALVTVQHRRTMALLAPRICSPAASRPTAILTTQKTPCRPISHRCSRLQTSAQGAPAVAVAAWQVYTGKMPLVGFEKVAAALKHVQPAQQLLELHTYTLLQGPNQVWYFDFLPLRPTHPATAAMLLSASAAPGELRVRRLEARAVRASSSVRLVGSCHHDNPLELAAEFNRTFNLQLHLLHNNCGHHTDGLTRLLLTTKHS